VTRPALARPSSEETRRPLAREASPMCTTPCACRPVPVLDGAGQGVDRTITGTRAERISRWATLAVLLAAALAVAGGVDSVRWEPPSTRPARSAPVCTDPPCFGGDDSRGSPIFRLLLRWGCSAWRFCSAPCHSSSRSPRCSALVDDGAASLQFSPPSDGCSSWWRRPGPCRTRSVRALAPTCGAPPHRACACAPRTVWRCRTDGTRRITRSWGSCRCRLR
jgi:hypothetical protein